MAYLTAAVVMLGLVCLMNLVLSFGLVRRVRVHAGHLNRLLESSRPDGVPVGETVGEFTATTVGGEPVSRALLEGRTLVGFFSPGCQPCAAQLPRFVEHAQSMPDGPYRVLAVVDVAGEHEPGYVERLAEVAQVVVEGPDGGLRAAFQVTGFPMLYLVTDGGVVVASGYTMADLAGERSREAVRR